MFANFREQKGPLLFAHRGAHERHPENTLASFQEAVHLGVGAIETDVHMTKDGQIVIHHDSRGVGSAGVDALIKNTTWAELRTWDLARGQRDSSGKRWAACSNPAYHGVPLLADALIACPHVLFNVDIKPVDMGVVRRVIEVVMSLGASDRTLITSFSSRNIACARRLSYPGPLGCGRHEVIQAYMLPAFALATFLSWAHRIQVPRRYGWLRFDSKRFILKCHRVGLQVDYWGVNDPAVAENLLKAGADGIVTDKPHKIAPVFASIF